MSLVPTGLFTPTQWHIGESCHALHVTDNTPTQIGLHPNASIFNRRLNPNAEIIIPRAVDINDFHISTLDTVTSDNGGVASDNNGVTSDNDGVASDNNGVTSDNDICY